MKQTVIGKFLELGERENEVKIAISRAVKRLTGYKPSTADIDIDFTFEGGAAIVADLKITSLNGALQLLEYLHTDEKEFMQKFGDEISVRLFDYLVFNNRIASINYYSETYKVIRLSVTDYILGARAHHQFNLG